MQALTVQQVGYTDDRIFFKNGGCVVESGVEGGGEDRCGWRGRGVGGGRVVAMLWVRC